jgi:hypothetical protein
MGLALLEQVEKWAIIRLLLAGLPMELLRDPQLNSNNNSSLLVKVLRSYTSLMLNLLRLSLEQGDISLGDLHSRATNRTLSGLKLQVYLRKR